MLLFSLAIIVGLVFLVLSADRFVAGSAAIANNFGVPHIIIGVTIVSLGTSAPEIIAATLMSIEGRVDMAMGNAIGSNIANIGLVLGATALIAPIPISKRLITNENLIMLLVTLGVGLILINLQLEIYEGLLLLAALTGFLAWIYFQNQYSDEEKDEFDDEIPNDMSTPVALGWFVLGLVVLVGSARMLVWGAVGIATTYGISDAIIGATIIAIGTSLPELAASAMSAIKKHHDIAIGNILGSNIFNMLAVIAVPALVAPSQFGAELLHRDYSFMLAISALLFILLVVQGKRGKSLGRVIGTIFVVMYAAYGYLAYQAATSL
ncbi:calcium/sodium antiporter [Reinekea marinisedimentorum]|uniref:Cation:H+ antiporter n=1 Tax=Reinekea marinisedimentorum TaxID=230495 RepID=A0A4R3HWV8_9GAMM|nr:calcium/sodium antiporter [Reinekea marinisedimentorum]TCS37628.1 cation:H+ antiporter [Reinekea marinisedimentorum]